MTECRFTGMDLEVKTDDEGHTTGRRYRGTCACGHKDEWTTEKDKAWHAIADHLLPALLARLRLQG